MTTPLTLERDARFKDLVDLLLSVPSDIFNPFDIYRTYYRSASSDIGADVIIPKGKRPRTARPVIVRIHGGFLVTGSSLFPAWFSKWVLDFAAEHSAVIISPNYRLLPEVRGVDIIGDMREFWAWVQGGGPERYLETVGRSDVKLDLRQLLLVGESAGGYLALQSAISGFAHPKAMIVLYPMLDMQADHYTKPFPKPIVKVPNFPNELIDDFIATMPTGRVFTEADPPSRLALGLAVVQTGRFLEFFGDEPDLFILERLKTGNLPARSNGETILPPIYILHGEQDTAVPVEGTRKLVRCLQEVDPGAKVHLAIRPGDHGFDAAASVNDEWMRKGLDFIEREWITEERRL